MESGTDANIFDALATLPEYVEANFPDGLSIEHTENGVSWQNGEKTVFSYADADGTQVVSLHLPDLVDFSATLRRDALLFTGALSLQSDVLNADVSFSLPASYPVTLPFYAQIDADGMMTGDDGIHLAFEGEAQGDTVIIRRIQPDHSATMMTLTVKVIQVAEGTVKYAPEDVPGHECAVGGWPGIGGTDGADWKADGAEGDAVACGTSGGTCAGRNGRDGG